MPKYKHQKRSRLGGVGAAITGLGLLAIATLGGHEGLRLYVYKDVIGVWTYCYGETKGAAALRGQRFTKEKCDAVFITRLNQFEQEMRACIQYPDLIPDKSYVAFLSLAYNIGSGGFCKSSVARAINAGNLTQACNNLLKFNKAGGKVIKGLVRRRNEERTLCLKGVKEGPPPPPPLEPVGPLPPIQ
jgi:lysozyme